MKKQIINTTAFALLITGIIFSCKKKEDTEPDNANTSTTTPGTTTGGTTTGGTTTGGTTTGGATNTNTLATNTFEVIKNGAATTYTTYGGIYNGVQGNFKTYAMGTASSGYFYFKFNTASTPSSGLYSVVSFTAAQSSIINANEVGIDFYENTAHNGQSFTNGVNTVSVTNLSNKLKISAVNIPAKSILGFTTTVSANFQEL